MEVEPEQVTAFVRDRGKGFDLDAVEPGRLGVRESIIGRMARHGGRAEVHSTPGEGTEVVLEVARWPGRPRHERRPAVFLVDDHQMFRTGVRAELGDRVEVVGEAADVESAVQGIRATDPEVVLLDVHLPGGGGKAVIETLKPALPDLVFLALSVSDAAEDVIAVIRAGARGYVTKTISSDDLAAAIRRVRDGDAVFSPRLAGFVLDAFAGEVAPEVADPELDQLSPREREVMRLIARGYTYKELARRLDLSVKTVETHVSAVLRKLQLSQPPRAHPLGHRPPPDLSRAPLVPGPGNVWVVDRPPSGKDFPMPRAIWSGSISFGLVNIPIKLYAAVSRKTVHFNQLDSPHRRRG